MRKAITLSLITIFLTFSFACDRTTAPSSPSIPSTTQASASATTQQVTIDNFTFTPAELTIPAGTTVTWINHDDVPHTATSTASPPLFNSKALDTDQKFSFTFTTPGTYAYFCAVHTHMTGKVIVK